MRNFVFASASVIALATVTTAAQAADPAPAVTGQSSSSPPAVYLDAPVPSITSYFLNWFNRVDQAQASQPHWMTPLVTVTPRLEEEVRYDQYWEHQHTGADLDLYDMGKGLELIPTTTNEILLNPPVYEQRSNKSPAAGWGDDQFLVIKQRLLSANEETGNYIVTAFLGVQAPTGDRVFTNHAWLVTPTIAGGKGWGDFDVQATVGIALPTDHESDIGKALATNVTFQYHIAKYFWPEFEVNYTHWFGGERDGKDQVFLTPGIILGRFQVYDRLRVSIGGGYQFAVSPKVVTEPALTPTYDHAWILSARASF
jgi:hypothetical protein